MKKSVLCPPNRYYVLERYPGVARTGPDAEQVRHDLEEARNLILALFPDEQVE